MALDGFAGRVGTRTGALDGCVVAPFRRESHADQLAQPPLRRAVRSALEAAHCSFELRELLGNARAMAPRSRDLRNLLAAAELAATDLAAETDEIGLALLQMEIVAGGKQ
jgi:hypothetical protein